MRQAGVRLLFKHLLWLLGPHTCHADGTASDASSIVSYSNDPAKYIFEDFANARDGTVYLATGNENVITEVEPNGDAAIVAGNSNSTEIAEPTALAFGRTWRDWNTLYVTTGGGIGDPINGTVVVGGRIVALDFRTDALQQ